MLLLVHIFTFTKPNFAFHGSTDYNNTTSQCLFYVNNSTTDILTISTTGISVIGTSTASSDKRLKFNETPVTNALDIINRLEPCEYQQTQEIVDLLTPDIQQSHQCGFIAQQVQHIDELNTRLWVVRLMRMETKHLEH